ncbi:hypothetical protein EVAR_98155_1 [Eumeta japonica]|uniref:Uncharacterized protein n=1 Tax=Eumeta variegata TaxID=151549 RepID=A0A4C1XSL9_EUMVA|nr:hypothetical protein EVAR_98155_1 [Eumeta japonica]
MQASERIQEGDSTPAAGATEAMQADDVVASISTLYCINIDYLSIIEAGTPSTRPRPLRAGAPSISVGSGVRRTLIGMGYFSLTRFKNKQTGVRVTSNFGLTPPPINKP